MSLPAGEPPLNRKDHARSSPSALNTTQAPRETIAVIDIGSNSGRVVVLRQNGGILQVIEDVEAPLRLVEAIEATGGFPPEVVQHTLVMLRDFCAIATNTGADRIVAVGTSAVRDASNQAEFIAQLQNSLGIQIDVITGKEEAAYAFNGAIQGMAVEHGALVDIGGGSMQIVRFRRRKLLRSWTFPLGSLRLSTRYLHSDPPSPEERQELADFLEQTLAEARLPRLRADETLVGTGGTIRSLARVDRKAHKYPITRLHGYVLGRLRLQHLKQTLENSTREERLDIRGLNADRVDSLVAGSFTVQAVMNATHANELHVSGSGLRDGLAIGKASSVLASVQDVRNSAIAALTARFASWDQASAARRTRIATGILEAMGNDKTSERPDLLAYAASLLDIGRGVDYYNRHDHTASMILETDLPGFSHHELAILSGIVRCAGSPGTSLKGFGPLLSSEDQDATVRMGAVLDIADELEKRCAPDAPLNFFRFERSGDKLVLYVPLLDDRALMELSERYRDILGGQALCTN